MSVLKERDVHLLKELSVAFVLKCEGLVVVNFNRDEMKHKISIDFGLSIVLLVFLATQAHAIDLAVQSISGSTYVIRVSNWSTQDLTNSNCVRAGRCGLSLSATFFGGATVAFNPFTAIGSFDSSKTTPVTLGEMRSQLDSLGFSNPFTVSVVFPPFSGARCIYMSSGAANGAGRSSITGCFPLVVAPEPVKCNISGNTNIDHRALLSNALAGAQASTQLSLTCGGAAKVIVRATRTNSYGVMLRSDDSLYSEVKINGVDATDGITVSVANNLSSASVSRRL